MNLKNCALLLIALPLPVLSWLDPINPPPFITMPAGYGIPSISIHPGATNWANNHCLAFVREVQPRDPQTGKAARFLYRLMVPLDDCFGVHVEPQGESVPEETLRRILRAVQAGVALPYERQHPVTNTTYGFCEAFVGVIRNYYMSTIHPLTFPGYHPGECVANLPVPVECTVAVPNSLVHNQSITGRIDSEAKGRVVVQCNRTASVTVSAMTSSIQLRGDSGGNLRSSIQIGTRTGNSTTATADPVVNVDIWSTINDTADTAGTYTGSTVLTVQWD